MIEFIKSKQTSFFDIQSQTRILVDTMLNGQHTYTTDVTEFPIASGEVIADHAIRRPLVISLTCSVTNTPAVSSGGSVSLDATSLTVSSGTNEISAANDAYSNLLMFWENKTVLIVSNGLTTLHNMMLTSVVVDLSRKSNHTFYFNVTMKQVLIVNSQIVDVKNIDSSLADKTVGEAKIGTVDGKDDGPLDEHARSIILGGAATF